MGRDKSFISISERPLIEILIDRLSNLCRELIIITNKPRLYKRYRIRTEQDILKGRGSLGGIYTGLVSSKDIYNFIAPCDMPFINQGLVQYMLKEANGYDAVIARYNGRLQPLGAVYSKNCIGPIEHQLSKDNLRLTDFLQAVKARMITEEEVKRIDPDGLSFVNINTEKDYQWILQNCLPG